MYVVPLSKTAIVLASRPKLLLKLRKVSKNMRKRVSMVIEKKRIKISKYKKQALSLNNWVSQGNQAGISIDPNQLPNKGVSNYIVNNQTHIDALKTLNAELRCYLKLSRPVEPVFFENLTMVEVNSRNCAYYLNVKLNKVTNMALTKLSSEEINKILENTNSIHKLTIQGSSFGKLDLSGKKLKKLFLIDVSLTNWIKLPNSLDLLMISKLFNFEFIKPRNVTELRVSYKKTAIEEKKEWLKQIKGVKEIEFDCNLSNFLDVLPKSLRKIRNDEFSKVCALDSKEIKSRFPFLIAMNLKISILLASQLNLRRIYGFYYFEDTEEKLTVRPRKLEVNRSNYDFLQKHPELFEKTEALQVNAEKFDLKYLNKGIKSLLIDAPFSKSRFLTRLEGKCKQIKRK